MQTRYSSSSTCRIVFNSMGISVANKWRRKLKITESSVYNNDLHSVTRQFKQHNKNLLCITVYSHLHNSLYWYQLSKETLVNETCIESLKQTQRACTILSTVCTFIGLQFKLKLEFGLERYFNLSFSPSFQVPGIKAEGQKFPFQCTILLHNTLLTQCTQ